MTTLAPDEQPTIELRTYRDDMRKVSPTWLQRGLAEKILYAFALHLDVLGDAVVAGVKQRFPGAYSMESLSLIARERRISRGLQETDEAFALRLTRWLVDHQKRGGPYALLKQVVAHYAPDYFDVDLLYANGRRFMLDADVVAAGGSVDDAVTRDITDWSPADGDHDKWARWYLLYYTDRWATTPPTADEIEDLRHVPHAWNAAHCTGTIILFSSGSELWDLPPGHKWNESGKWNTTEIPRFIEVDPT